MAGSLTFVWITTLGLLRWPLLLGCALALRWVRGRKRLGVGLVLAIVLGDMAVEKVGRPSDGEGGGRTLSVFTHNVLYDGGDAAATAEVVLAEDVDVVFLQEVGTARAAFFRDALKDAYPYHLEALPELRGHGLLVFAKEPMAPIDRWSTGRGNVVGQCFTVGDVPACNVHLTSPSVAFDNPRRFVPVLLFNERFRRAQWATIESVAAEHDALLMVGDVNTMVVEPLFRDLRRRWVDAYRRANPLNPGATYPHGTHGPPDKLARPGRPFVRPDYVLTAPSVRVLSARTLVGGGSDHRPLVVEVELPPS